MSGFRIPFEATLSDPLVLPSEGLVSYEKYSALARGQISHLRANEHKRIEEFVFGQDVEGMTSAFYSQSIDEIQLSLRGMLRERSLPRRVRCVTGLGIWVNTDFFGQTHKDFIPYAEEHEAYESWLITSPHITVEQAHLAARVRQFEVAARDHQATKLYKHYLAVNPTLEQELSICYQAVMK